jgi:hypothetical protein
MGCRIIVGHDDDGLGTECACFYDSVTGTVFGRQMNDLEEADSFQTWVFEKYKKDLRQLSDVEFSRLLDDFREERENE